MGEPMKIDGGKVVWQALQTAVIAATLSQDTSVDTA